MGIGFPSPLTVAHLRAWLSTEQTLVLSDLFGHVIDGNNPLSPGIYLVQTNGHAVQKVVVTE